MNSTTIDQRVADYLDAVRRHLGDVGDAERDDLLDDLREHLAEIAAEDDADLAERLGPPDRYAAELRLSAGLTAGRPQRSLRRRLAGTWPARLVRSVQSTDAYASVAGFLPELRPGWWVLRGYLAVVALDTVAGTDTRELVPRLFGSQFTGLLAVAAAAWASVALGRREPSLASARRGAWIINAAVVVLGVSPLLQAGGTHHVYIEGDPNPYLAHADGEPIANFCPYAADGEPLSGVLLYDGRGRPVENLAPILVSEDGRPPVPANAYPRNGMTTDPDTGRPSEHQCPRVIVTAPAQPEDAAPGEASPGPETSLAPEASPPSEPAPVPES